VALLAPVYREKLGQQKGLIVQLDRVIAFCGSTWASWLT